MKLWARKPVVGLRPYLLHYHVEMVDKRFRECYHYDVPDDEARAAIESGKAKLLAVPWSCAGAEE